MIQDKNDPEHHARFSPSKLSRILSCTGSVLFEEHIVAKESSSYAQEGTRLHDLIAKTILSTQDGNHLTITEPLVQECYDYVSMLLSAPDAEIIGVEKKVTLLPYGEPDVYGTVDLAIYETENNVLHVIDWKFGYNIVYATENDQLLAYAAGLIATDDFTALNNIVLHIFQPAIDHIHTWSISTEQLLKWIHDTMYTLADVRNNKVHYKPSVEACKWCKGAATCRANHDFNMSIAEDVFAQYIEIAEDRHVTPADLKDILNRGKAFKQYLTVIHDYIMNELMTKGEYPGYKLVAGRASRNWINEHDLIAWIGDDPDFDVDDVYETKLKTPAKVEKLNKAWKQDEGFQALYKKTSKPIIVSDEDKRPTYNTASVFADVKQTK